jgi:hypothetical protein
MAKPTTKCNNIGDTKNALNPGMRVIMHVPKSSLRTRDNLSPKGWIKHCGGYGIFGNWKLQFLSLWHNSLLYVHCDDGSMEEGTLPLVISLSNPIQKVDNMLPLNC